MRKNTQCQTISSLKNVQIRGVLLSSFTFHYLQKKKKKKKKKKTLLDTHNIQLLLTHDP